MRFQKTAFTRWLISFALSLLLVAIAGCGGPIATLTFPLDNGGSWTYQGAIAYDEGGQAQTMPSLTFNLGCRQLAAKKPSPFELAFQEEGENLFNLQLASSPKGLANPLTGELWLPSQIKVGRKWYVTVQGNRVKMILRDTAQFTTVPAGTFPTYQVNFIGPKKDYGSFWLDKSVGIIELKWISRVQGAKSTTDLALTSYNLP